jgi:hypothetical protein
MGLFIHSLMQYHYKYFCVGNIFFQLNLQKMVVPATFIIVQKLFALPASNSRHV